MNSAPQQKPESEEVFVSSSSDSLPDRAVRIVAILDRIDFFAGLDAAKTILEDESKNLAGFAESQDCPSFIKARIKAALK